MTNPTVPDQLEKDLELLRTVRKLVGRMYKSHIWEAWMDGNYIRRGLEEYAGRLHSLRNRRGPTWLSLVKVGAAAPVAKPVKQTRGGSV